MTKRREGYEAHAGAPDREPATARTAPAPLAEPWAQLVGEYGETEPVIVFEADATDLPAADGPSLAVLLPGGAAPIPLTARGPLELVLAAGPRAGESLVFRPGRTGAAAAAVLFAGERLFRQRFEQTPGHAYRVQPRAPLAALRRLASAATPPDERDRPAPPDLVELVAIDTTIALEIRYATRNNFLGAASYTDARAFLQRPIAEALVRVHQRLAGAGFGLLVYDAYRPWSVTKLFWDAVPDEARRFVADPEKGSRHNRGAAVDLTLYDRRTGAAVEMPSGYDEFSSRARADFLGGTARARFHRELLRAAMAAEGFVVHPFEWWHFDHVTWSDYPISNAPFGSL